MRPRPARWFELLTSREDLGGVLDCLARTGRVQLETYSDISQPETLPELRALVEEFLRLSRRYGAYWPEPTPSEGERGDTDLRAGTRVLEKLRDWSREAENLVTRLDGLAEKKEELEAIRDWLQAAGAGGLPDLQALGLVGPSLAARLYCLPPGAWPAAVSPSLLLHKTSTEQGNYLLVVGSSAQVDALDESIRALKGRVLRLPGQLPPQAQQSLEEISRRLQATLAQREDLTRQMQDLNTRSDLAGLLAHMQFLRWVAEKVPQMAMTEHFAWVTGWTSDLEGQRISDVLERSGLNYLIRFPPAPQRAVSPMVLRNPAWARPFELFGRLLGTPSAAEADPSVILAFVAPVLFGYMFGDVGQGAVLLLAGLALRKRLPPLSLLIPGGFMAMVFGLLFGSVFANEQLMPALWVRPLEQPLPVLVATLVMGSVLITVGLFLDALQSHWAGLGRRWWQGRAGLLLLYLCLVSAPLWPPALLGVPVAALWFVLGGSLPLAPGWPGRAGSAIAELLETVLQLLVNTISFIRVGAFALAHAGLSVAVTGVAESFDSAGARLAAFILGNLLILVLEGLVVGIQATRLVLFEFFVRFLRAEGRAFDPLSAPGDSHNRHVRRPS